MMDMKKLYMIFIAAAVSLTVSAQELTILHFNDTHSHIDPERSGKNAGMGGVVEQAAYIDSVRCADGSRNVLLVHAGDFSQGTSYFTELHGNLEIDILNAMRFDAVTLGNHEFDNGMSELARRIRNLDVPVVCANYDFSGSPLEGLVKPYVILKKAGKKVAVVGLLTDVSTVVDRKVADMMKYQNPVTVVNEYAGYLKNVKKCDLVVVLSHLGYDGGGDTDCELAAKVRNVDIIVGGHSHTHLDDLTVVRNPDGKYVVIVSDWKWGLEIGNLNVIAKP